MGKGVESLGAIGGRGESGLGRVARDLGMGQEAVQGAELSSGGLKGTVESYGKELQAGGSDIGEATGKKLSATRGRQEVHSGLRKEAVEAFQDQAPAMAPSMERIAKRLDAEVMLPRVGTMAESSTAAKLDSVKKELEDLFIPGSGKPPTWQNIIKSRDQLAELVGKESSAAENHLMPSTVSVKREVLNVLDSEIRTGMEAASAQNPALAGMDKQYAAATQGAKTSSELSAMLGKKHANELLNPKSLMGGGGSSGFAGMMAIRHPLSSIGYVGSKLIGKVAQERVEPWLAKMAYNQAIGTKAAEATLGIKNRIGESLKSFFTQAAKTPAKAINVAKAERTQAPPSTRAAYESIANHTEQLMSHNHLDRVQRYAQSMETEGYDQLANEVMGVNQRAVQYAQWNMPPRQGSKAMNSLRQFPASKSPTFQEYKFMRVLDGINSGPESILKGLENGSVNRDSVKAVKYVYPELHTEIVTQAAQQIAEMKSKGQYLPMNKIASLGIALDAPIDPVLEPDFVGAVQAGLNAPPAEQQPSGKDQSSQPQVSNVPTLTRDNPMLTTLQQTAVT
jgi:hypothetical protein